MPRIDRPSLNPNLAPSCITKPRKKENEFSNAQTNTDPWQPPCQTCLQKKNSQFVYENNTIDMNEYVKAINYINAIHGLINETLLCKPSEQGLRRNSNLNLKANISMPDLPNFLTLLSSINNFNNNVNTSPSEMISRTTSTSNLTNTLPVINKPVEQIQEDEKCLKCNEYSKEGDSEHSNSKENLLDTNVEEANGQGDQTPQSADEEVPDSDGDQEFDPTNFPQHDNTETYYVMQNRECNCKHCSNSSLKHNIEEDNIVNTKEEIPSQHRKQSDQYHEHVVPDEVEDQQEIDLQRKKATPTIHMSYQVTTKNKDNCSYDRKKSSDENYRGRHFEPILSDAELDRYASELLIGADWESCDNSVKSGDTALTFTVPIHKHVTVEKARTVKCRPPPAPTPEPARRVSVQKAKEGPTPQVKQKSVTQIPVKQNIRPPSPITKRSSSRSCSPTKHKISNSTSSVRPASPNFSPRSHLKKDTPTHIHIKEGCTSVHNEKQESIKTFRPTTITKPKIMNFKLPSLTSLEKDSISKQHKHIAFQSQRKPQQHENEVQKGMVTYKVQQKEVDDFVCPRKTPKTQLFRKSSDSVILTDIEDRGGVIPYTDSDIHEDVCEMTDKQTKGFVFRNKGSQGTIQGSSRKSSRNDLENASQDLQRSNERFAVSGPTRRRKDLRNKPFRQARRQSGDSEEIVHIRNYISPNKDMNDSDSNSNDSCSSDIKSDKESSPLQQIFKIPKNLPTLINYTHQSREHIQHKM